MKFDLELLEFVECNIDPDKLAISGSDKDLSWSEFKEEVEKQKERLLSYHLPKGHPIIIYGHKEANFIVSMVACMSLKMPYIPIDTIYPQERLNKIIHITKSALLIDLVENNIKINQEYTDTTYARDDQIIYIIFTSGSTGEPKGVQITKESILDFQIWLTNDFHFSQKNIFMNQAPFSFDLSVYELVGFLLFGGSILLNSRELIDNHLVYFKRLKDYKCNTWVSTPSFIGKYLMSSEFNTTQIKSLNTFLFCGEILPAITAKRILNNFPTSKVLNSYGPTEATVATTLINITDDIIQKYAKSLPVGYIKPNTTINILDPDDKGIGEIEIVGDNVSIGYFNNEELNKNKFTPTYKKRSFKTGDYGYFENKMLFFANRKDELIKMHGFRIELGEIDKEIHNYPEVIDAITIPLKRRGEIIKLISFILVSKEVIVDNIKKSISKNLPYYMIPSDIIQLKELPYNTNHKVDKKALLEIYKKL